MIISNCIKLSLTKLNWTHSLPAKPVHSLPSGAFCQCRTPHLSKCITQKSPLDLREHIIKSYWYSLLNLSQIHLLLIAITTTLVKATLFSNLDKCKNDVVSTSQSCPLQCISQHDLFKWKCVYVTPLLGPSLISHSLWLLIMVYLNKLSPCPNMQIHLMALSLCVLS